MNLAFHYSSTQSPHITGYLSPWQHTLCTQTEDIKSTSAQVITKSQLAQYKTCASVSVRKRRETFSRANAYTCVFVCALPLDFFTSGSGSASLMNWPSSFTFPKVILLRLKQKKAESGSESSAQYQASTIRIFFC